MKKSPLTLNNSSKNISLNVLLGIVFLLFNFFCSGANAQSQAYVTAQDLATLKDIGGHHTGAISVSPDGNWVAFQIQIPNVDTGSYTLNWMTISTISGGKVEKVAGGGDLILNPALVSVIGGDRPPVKAKWSPDSKFFAYTLRRNSETQIWLSQLGRKGQRQLTYSSADVIDFEWAPDGKMIFFHLGNDREESDHIKKIESASGFLFDDRFRPTFNNKPIERFCSYSGGVNPVGVALARNCVPDLYVYEFHSRTERLAEDEDKMAYEALQKRTRSSDMPEREAVFKVRSALSVKNVAWLENEDPEIYTGVRPFLRLFARSEAETFRCESDTCLGPLGKGVIDFWWRSNGNEVVFIRRDGPNYSKTGMYVWTLLTGEVKPLLLTEDWVSDCQLANDHLICIQEGATRPRAIVSISLADGTVENIYDPNPQFSNFSFTKIEKLDWKDGLGKATHGHLVYPRNYQDGQRYPLVIVTYISRGFLRGGVGDEYPIHPLAAEGFFVLSHNTSVDYDLLSKDKSPSKRLYKDLILRKRLLSSQELIVDSLVKRGLVDGSRVAITGLSEGAQQVSYALFNSNKFATAIASSTGVNANVFSIMNEKQRERWRQILHGEPGDDDSEWKNISLGMNAEKVHASLLINVSSEELLFSLGEYHQLKDAGKAVEMYVFPDGNHIKWRPDQRYALYRRNIQWLKFWLSGEVEDNPVSVGQYERWKDLCSQQQEIGVKNSINISYREKVQPCFANGIE